MGASGDRATFPVAPGITAVDTRMTGRAVVTSGYLVAGGEPALVETGPTTSADAVIRALGDLGVGPAELAHIVVTHIHLDHAGGAGTLAARFPRATIWVHERGAPHLADPTRLVASAARVFGEERMRAWFGPVDPVPADRLRSVGHGDRIALGGRALDVLHTPGHASHHVALQDDASGAIFVGDALGVHLPDVGVLRPATPPPEFDLEASLRSVELIRERSRGTLLLSHFGPFPRAEELCELAARRLRGWVEAARAAMAAGDDEAAVERALEELARRDAEEDGAERADVERYDIVAGPWMNAMGLARFLRRAGAGPEERIS
ncbi:MAG TPA: MBL fold metallo-hydrolase [Actinomycetota bacterium]|nr:MBL fold metallo-hydrolase [Actinomycetota bacterium]